MKSPKLMEEWYTVNVLTIVTHPRRDALTLAVAERFVEGLKAAGHETEVLDLYRSGFDPVLRESDEPDWTAGQQVYSPAVEEEMARLQRQDALAFVFPLWWWSMPAMMKGYIDRVWNYGFAYGPQRLQHRQVLWLTLAGAPPEKLVKRRYDQMIEHYFNEGIASYCGIARSSVELLYDTVPGPATAEQASHWLAKAYELGLHYEDIATYQQPPAGSARGL
ncbi:NAD(P)H oxidoreductase [Paenibacillus sp. 1P07SE]|uniref:NAD(P)H oxidoreductase n=1 Tax=Paenibacillus sp. 1P07SE TaxID=3132209 RepID=UPI0039A70D1E